METQLVQAWNSGKWHIFEDVLGIHPAEPVGPFNNVAKPERAQAMSRCGLRMYVKATKEIHDRSDFTFITKGGWERQSLRMCSNCLAVLTRKYPKP